MVTHRYVIIGTSAAGLAAATALRSLDRDASIVCISHEQSLPYNKCLLAGYVAGDKTLEQVYTKSPAWFAEQRIDLLLDTFISKIDTEGRSCLTAGGNSIAYDRLFLGVGAYPKVPPWAHEQAGVFTFHTLNDSQRIRSYAHDHKVKDIVIVGAGITGLECADALYAQGFSITLIDKAPYLGAQYVDQRAGTFIKNHIDRWVRVMVGDEVIQLVSGDQGLSGVMLARDVFVPAQMIVVAIGVQPSLALASSAGLATHEQGMVVNAHMQTSNQSIYAGGDAIAWMDMRLGCYRRNVKWSDAVMQGTCAAYNMAGISKTYAGLMPVIKTSFFGLHMITSYTTPYDHGDDAMIVERSGDAYYKFQMHENYISNFLMIKTTPIEQALQIRQSFIQRTPIDARLLSLL